MVTNTSNPLMKHFRQPAIYLKLPSNGAYWPEGSIDLPVTNEVPVLPMTTRDEITLRTPDALLNGQGVVDVIRSCIPSIKDPWKMPSVDVDAALVAIRIASYGADMEVNSNCPHCKEMNSHTIDLSHIMPRYKMPAYDHLVDVDELKIKLKPPAYFSVNRNSQIMFEEQRILQAINDETVPEATRTIRFNEHMSKLISLNIDSLTASTQYIETPDGLKVTDENFIRDYYANASTGAVKAVRERLDSLSEEATLPKVQVQCESCEATYDMSIEFNYSTFFDQGS